jgi:hypothetical protein
VAIEEKRRERGEGAIYRWEKRRTKWKKKMRYMFAFVCVFIHVLCCNCVWKVSSYWFFLHLFILFVYILFYFYHLSTTIISNYEIYHFI